MGPARNVEEVAESLAREIIGIVSDSLPDLKVLQHSDRLRLFGLAMAELQRVRCVEHRGGRRGRE